MDNNCSGSKEFTLDLKDMFADFIRNLHVIIVCMVIFAVALSGLKYIRDLGGNGTLSYSRDDLTEEENKAIDKYLENYFKIEEYEKVLEESELMKLNSGQVHKLTLLYHFESESPLKAGDIAEMYENYVNNGGMEEYLSQDTAEDKGVFCQELITASSPEDSGCLKITIYGKDEKSCEDNGQLIKEAFNSYKDHVLSAGYGHTFSVIDESLLVTVDTDLYQEQVERNDMMTTLSQDLWTKYSVLNDVQKAVAEREIQNIDQEAQDNAAQNIQISKGFALLGALAGFVFGILVIFVKYLFGGTVKSAAEIEKMYDIPVICEVGKTNLRGLKKIADKLVYKTPKTTVDEERNFVVTKLEKIYTNFDVEKLVLTNVRDDKPAKEVAKMAETLKEKNINCEIIKDLSFDAQSISTLTKDSKVILVEMVKRNKYSEVIEQLKICKELKVSVLGVILLHQ